METRILAMVLTALLWLVPGVGRSAIDLWPLLVTGDDELTILYPLYVQEGKFRMHFPFYYRTNEGQDHHVMWPLVKFSEGRLHRVAPIWFSAEEGTYTFLPFIHRDPEQMMTLLPPMYTRQDGSLRAILPLYARTPTDLYAFPGYYRLRRPGEPEVDGVYGLYKRSHSLTETKASALLYSYYYKKTPDSSSFVVGYLYWNMQDPSEKLRMLLPLAVRYETGEQRHLFIFPYYQNRGPDTTATYFMGVIGRTRSKELDRDYFFPFFTQSRWRSTTNTTSTHILWPVYARREETNQAGELVAQRRRFLFFIDDLERDGTRVFSILGLPVMERTPS